MQNDATPTDPGALDSQASVLMKDGLRRIEEGTPEAAADALVRFDAALALRQQLPLADHPDFGYGLAACWLNRADALCRLGGVERIEAALASFDEAITVLRTLPLDRDPRYMRRLAIACQNRGLALRALGGARAAESPAAFLEAIELLQSTHTDVIPDQHYLLGAALTNLANDYILSGTAESMRAGHDAAKRAIVCVSSQETEDLEAAEVGLKARHVLCQTLAFALTMHAQSGAVPADLVHATTDAVDDGLALARTWERKGVERYREVAVDLFRFGARVYAAYQPHFLGEFIGDNGDASQSSEGYVTSPRMQAAVQEAMALVAGIGARG